MKYLLLLTFLFSMGMKFASPFPKETCINGIVYTYMEEKKFYVMESDKEGIPTKCRIFCEKGNCTARNEKTMKTIDSIEIRFEN